MKITKESTEVTMPQFTQMTAQKPEAPTLDEQIDALRLHAQHLQDRLNRMGAAGQMCVDALLHRGVSTDPEHPDRLAVDAMSAALLAKVEGRE